MNIETQNPRPVMPPPPVQDLEHVHEPAVMGARPPLAAAFRFVEPTWRNYIAYVDAEARTGNADARRYVAIWQALPRREHDRGE